jgi:hypothetical protein
LPDASLHLAFSAFIFLLDTRGVDTPIVNQVQQRDAGNLATNRLERRQHDRLGRVVDDHIDARDMLEVADIASLTPDDAPFDVLAGQVDDRDSVLRDMFNYAALHCVEDNLTGAAFGVAFGVLLDLPCQDCRFVFEFVAHFLQEQFTRLLRAHTANALQFEASLVHEFTQFALLFGQQRLALHERVLFLLQKFEAVFQQFLALQQALFEFEDFGAFFARLLFGEFEDFMCLFTRL